MSIVEKILSLHEKGSEEELINIIKENNTEQNWINCENEGSESLLEVVVKKFIEDGKEKEKLKGLVEKFLPDGKLSSNQVKALKKVLLRALPQHYFEVIELLITKFKSDHDWIEILKENNYYLMHDSLTKSRKDTELEKEDDAIVCLEFLRDKKIITDINQLNPDKEIELHVLNTAADYNYQRAMAYLMNNGACLSDVKSQYRKSVIDTLTTEKLTDVMDHHCTQRTDQQGVVEMNYKFLVKPYSSEKDIQNETDTLMELCHTKKHKDIVKHPLIKTLIQAKWSKLRWCYYLFLFIRISLSLALACLVNELTWPMSNCNFNVTNCPKAQGSGVKIALSFVWLVELLHDVFWWIFFCKWKWPLRSKYYRLFEMFCHAALLLVIVVFLFRDWDRHFAAWIVPITWLSWLVELGQNLPPFKIFITMLRRIFWHLLKLTLLTFVLIFAFSLSFCILIQANEHSEDGAGLSDLSSAWAAFPRVVAMATGDFGYDTLRLGLRPEDRTGAALLFLVFVFLVFLVIMNTMTGVAIIEAQVIRDADATDTLQHRLGVAFLLEKITLKQLCWGSIYNKFHKLRYFPNFQLLQTKKRQLEFELNKPPPERSWYHMILQLLIGESRKVIKYYREEEVPGSRTSLASPSRGAQTTSIAMAPLLGTSAQTSSSRTRDEYCALDVWEASELRNEILELLERKQKEEQHEQRMAGLEMSIEEIRTKVRQ